MRTLPKPPAGHAQGECCARIGGALPGYARRRGQRCGATALDFRDVRLGGRPVELPLCRIHFRTLRDSADPAGLSLAWAPGDARG